MFYVVQEEVAGVWGASLFDVYLNDGFHPNDRSASDIASAGNPDVRPA